MAVENLFPSFKGCNGIDGNRRHAEATEAAQAAWDRTVAANARNEREADERRKAIKKPEEVRPVGCVLPNRVRCPMGLSTTVTRAVLSRWSCSVSTVLTRY